MFAFYKRKKVIKIAMQQLNLSKREAESRVDALLKSGIMQEGGPGDTWTQLRIENFLRFDLSQLDYKEVFQQTMSFPALVKEYDKINGQNLTDALKSLKNKNYDFKEVEKQVQLFDNFFCQYIWNYFPNVEKFGNIVAA